MDGQAEGESGEREEQRVGPAGVDERCGVDVEGWWRGWHNNNDIDERDGCAARSYWRGVLIY